MSFSSESHLSTHAWLLTLFCANWDLWPGPPRPALTMEHLPRSNSARKRTLVTIRQDTEGMNPIPSIQKPQQRQPELRPHWTTGGRWYQKRSKKDIGGFTQKPFTSTPFWCSDLCRSCGSKSFCVRWFDSCRGPTEKYPNCLQHRNLTSQIF